LENAGLILGRINGHQSRIYDFFFHKTGKKLGLRS
jgi:hypothetical protein